MQNLAITAAQRQEKSETKILQKKQFLGFLLKK